MNTAVSVPDDVFERAKRLARQTKKTRSRLFTEALREYVARHAAEEITDAMNRACVELGDARDPFVSFAALRVLERREWYSHKARPWWADLPAPTGSGRRFRRPAVVVQSDALNRSRLATVVCVPLTSNLRWASALGSLRLPASLTGLPKDSVANVSQIVSVDKDLLTARAGKLLRAKLELLLSGIDGVLGK